MSKSHNANLPKTATQEADAQEKIFHTVSLVILHNRRVISEDAVRLQIGRNTTRHILGSRSEMTVNEATQTLC